MPMQTGSATNVNNLADLLVTFATSNGWTQNGTTVTQGTGKKFHLSKGNVYLNFRTFNTETPSMSQTTQECNSQSGMLLSLSTGYNGAQDWYNQTGAALYSGSNATNQTQTVGFGPFSGAAIPTYYFFSLSGTGFDVLYIIVEYPSEEYQYLMAGMLDKNLYGSETSPKGLFATGTIAHTHTTRGITSQFFSYDEISSSWLSSLPNCIVNIQVDTGFNGFAYRRRSNLGTTVTSTPAPIDSIASLSCLFLNMPNTFNSLAPMFPIIVGSYETTGNYWVPLGELPFVYLTNITNYNPGDTVTISSDNYKIFPFFKKDITNAVTSGTSTGTLAYAIKY